MEQEIKQRTAAELDDPAYNYILAFGIDPNERNVAAMEITVKKHLSRLITGTAFARRMCELKDDVMTVIKDPNLLAREIDDAKRLKLAAATEAAGELYRSRRGQPNAAVYMSELSMIRHTSNTPFDYFTKDDFMKQVRRIYPQAEVTDNVSPVWEIDEALYLESVLAKIGAADLFDFLKVPSLINLSMIKPAVNAAAETVVKSGSAKYKPLALYVCRKASEIADDPAVREGFERYFKLKCSVYYRILEVRAAGGVYVSRAQADRFLQSVCNAIGGSQDRAREFLQSVFDYFGVTVCDAIGPSESAAVGEPSEYASVMPLADFSAVDKQLDTVRCDTLYEFLGLAVAASEGEIRAAIDEKYRAAMTSSDIKRKQAVSTVCAQSKKTLLTDVGKRRQYDNYIAIRHDVYDKLAQRKAFGLTHLKATDARYYLDIIKTALGSGCDAQALLSAGCKYHSIVPDTHGV